MKAPAEQSLPFWEALQEMVKNNSLRIDRPRGSRHPRYPDFIYPLDYGYLEGTRSADGGGVDVWLGTDRASCAAGLELAAAGQEAGEAHALSLSGLLLTVDRIKQDVEVKLLLNCTHEEMEIALKASNSPSMTAILLAQENLDSNFTEGTS